MPPKNVPFREVSDIHRVVIRHYDLVPGHFHLPQKSLPLSVRPSSSFSQPLATTDPLRVSVDLPARDISYPWFQTMCGLLCLACFIWRISQLTHVVAGVCPAIRRMYHVQFIQSLDTGGLLGWFPPFGHCE